MKHIFTKHNKTQDKQEPSFILMINKRELNLIFLSATPSSMPNRLFHYFDTNAYFTRVTTINQLQKNFLHISQQTSNPKKKAQVVYDCVP